MIQGWLLYLRCVARALFFHRGTPIRYTRNRCIAMFLLMPLCLLLWAMHAFFLLLDELLFPRYRRVRIHAPLFVVGPPRSGTTFLHRVLARDTERFTCFTLGEMVFAPSICEKYLLAFLARIDRLFSSPVERRLRRAEEKLFDVSKDIHRLSFFEPEEDYILLGYVFATHLLVVLFPFLEVFHCLYYFDREAAPAEKRRIMRFYRRCLQRHLYFHGADKTYFAKNPYFTPFILTLAEEFPDARFLINLREPLAVCASYLSLWCIPYDGLGNDPKDYLRVQFSLDWLRDMYLHTAACLQELGPERAQTIPYDALARHPRETILGCYARLGYAASPAFLAALDEEEARAKRYRSRHDYHLERFGLEEEAVRRHFAPVLGRFDFDSGRIASVVPSVTGEELRETSPTG